MNISKTEFIAYLDCPLKFYIIKDLNQNKPYGPRGERDYDDFPDESKEGMEWHEWFEEFHDGYEDVIITGPLPVGKNDQETKIKQIFFQLEQERFHNDPTNWKPIEKELYLQSEQHRGIIDRIDKLNDNEYRIVEYKGKQKPHQELELFFYVNLFQEVFLDKTVTEIATFSYRTGELTIKIITEEEMNSFKEKLEKIKTDILKPTWKRAKNCHEKEIRCAFKHFCPKITISKKPT